MTRSLPWIMLFSCLLLGCQQADQSGTAGADAGPSPFLEDVETRVVTASISGREYQISVALPLGYADSTRAYPVLYATDANGHFGMVVETARMLRIAEPQIPQLLIVGIGYPSGGRLVHVLGEDRSYDTTPTRDLQWEEVRGRRSGGAGDFLRFLREELFPLIDAEYRTDPSDRAIYGHSAGGRFALYSILEGEGAFRRAIVASPSLWWDDRYMFKLESIYAETHRSLSARLFLSVGQDEPDEEQDDIGCCQMVTNFSRLADILERRDYEGFEFRSRLFEGENHQSVVPVAISRGLRFIYESPR